MADTISKNSSKLILAALFATGFSGLVSEYVLATLASYILGDSILQWTLILSLMLFFMGVGSRVSRFVSGNLIEKFVSIELLLSLLISFASFAVYGSLPWLDSTEIVIYGLAITIGFLIGMEIPLVTRINSDYKSLKFNISAVMEWDYFGSLIGGLFFAFVGLRYIGIIYTPFIVGFVNLLVALVVYVTMEKGTWKRTLMVLGVIAIQCVGVYFAKDVVIYGDQARYGGQIVYSAETPFQKITITRTQDNYTLFLNQGKQLNTLDEWQYHEPLVHPALLVNPSVKRVLLMGAGDGGAVRELLKYNTIERIDLVELDSMVTYLAKTHPVFLGMNKGAVNSPKVRVFNVDAFNYVDTTTQFYDLIIADFPDPRNVDLAKLYSKEFYAMCGSHLSPNGVLITQAGSPFYTTIANFCIEKTISAAGYNAIPMHQHVYSFGEWGWILASKSLSKNEIKNRISSGKVKPETRMFGQLGIQERLLIPNVPLIGFDSSEVDVSTLYNPVVYRYYLQGDWSYEL